MDGRQQVKRQWYYLRIGDAGGEVPIDQLSQSGVSVTNGNFNAGDDRLNVVYAGMGLTVSVDYVLTGGSPDSGRSDLLNAISVTNQTQDAIDLHLFQFSDFDINGAFLDDSVQLTGTPPNTATLTDGMGFIEMVDSPAPDRVEAGLAADLLSRLEDGAPTTLSGALAAGPGDVAWAFQWDATIGPGGSLLIGKDTATHTMPLPSASGAGVALLCGLTVARRWRRRVG